MNRDHSYKKELNSRKNYEKFPCFSKDHQIMTRLLTQFQKFLQMSQISKQYSTEEFIKIYKNIKEIYHI